MNILDAGCGDGTLAVEIEKYGAKVVGVDMSEEMIEVCKAKGIESYVGSVTALPYEDKFDAVFSNAMLHWVKDARDAVENIAKTLKKDGRFVAEFGGQNNAHHLATAMRKVLMHTRSLECLRTLGTFLVLVSIKMYWNL